MDERKKDTEKGKANLAQGGPEKHRVGLPHSGEPKNIPPSYAAYDDDDDDTIIDLNPNPAALHKKMQDAKEAAQPSLNKASFYGFEGDDDEDTLLLPNQQSEKEPTTRSRGAAKRLNQDFSNKRSSVAAAHSQPAGPSIQKRNLANPAPSISRKPNTPEIQVLESVLETTPAHAHLSPDMSPRKLSDLKPYQDFGLSSENTVSSPRIDRHTQKKQPQPADEEHSPFDTTSAPSIPSLGQGNRDAAEGFDDGPTTPSLHSPANGFDSISETEIAGHSQTHSLASDEELPNYVEKEPSGILKIFAPDNGKVYLDGAYLGTGFQVVDRADPFALYQIRVLCPGHRPWTGTGSLQGKESLEVRPALKRRG